MSGPLVEPSILLVAFHRIVGLRGVFAVVNDRNREVDLALRLDVGIDQGADHARRAEIKQVSRSHLGEVI